MMASRTLVLCVIILVTPAIVKAESFFGVFADQSPLKIIQSGQLEAHALGVPNTNLVELDGGAMTFRFSTAGTLWDYMGVIAIPLGTQAILVDVATGDIDPAVYFGYHSDPLVELDIIVDGVPDAGANIATLLGHQTASLPYWDNDNDQVIYFFQLGPEFQGITTNFWLAVDDPLGGNFDLNAVQVVPEPSEALILVIGAALVSGFQNRRRRIMVTG